MPLWTRLQSMPLQRRISLLVVSGLLAIFVLLGFIGFVVVRDAIQRTTNERLVIARLVASFFDVELADSETKLEAVAARVGPELVAAEAQPAAVVVPRPVAEEFPALAASPALLEPIIERVVVLDGQGHIRAAMPDGPVDPSEAARLWALASVHDAWATGRTTISGLVAGAGDDGSSHSAMAARSRAATTDASGGSATICIAAPLRAVSGEMVGLLLGTVRPGDPQLSSAVSMVRGLGRSGHAELVDPQGLVLASTEPDHVGRPGEHLEFYLAARRSGQPQARTVPTSGAGHAGHETHVMAYAPLSQAPWGLALGGSEAEAMAPAWRWIRLLSGLAAASVAAALFLVWLTTRSVLDPVGALTRVAQRLADGDLDTAVAVHGEDEVGGLAHSFEEMRRKLLAAHRALAIEKSRYEGIVQSMADAVFVAGTDLRITSFNAAAERLTGWTAAEAIGKTCLELFRPEDEHGCMVCRYACPLAAGRAASGSDGCIDEQEPNQPALLPASPERAGPAGAREEATTEHLRRRDGTPLVVATARSCIYGEGSAPVGVVHVVRDVSAQEELRRLKDEFIATVSHELRTPLGFIKSYATTLLRKDTQWRVRTARRFLTTIDEAADELGELISNLLDMSRIRAGTLAIVPVEMRLDELAPEAAARMAPRLSAHQLLLDVPRSLPPLHADPRRVEQVLYNLVDNAIKYSPAGRSIAISAEVADGEEEVVVRVCDQGSGVPPEDRELIFERFHRGRSEAVERTSGSGLGLAICRGLVEAHGGRIWVDDSSPAGTTIAFSLPLAGAPATAADERRAPAGGPVRAVDDAPAPEAVFAGG